MNRLKTGLIALLVSLLFTACEKNDPPEEPTLPDHGAYTGTFIVAPGTEDAFTLPNARIELTISDDGTSSEMEMLQVKFAERMPSMDITVPGIALTKTAEGYSVSGERIVPFAMGGEVERYTITELTGTATEQTLSFEMMCGTYPLSFTGTRNQE